MFRILVLGNVFQQTGLVGEALVATVAFEWFVGLMRPGVGLQVGQLRECLGAVGHSALVRLVPRMCAQVLLKMRQLSELALTQVAAVRLDAQVDARVLRQVGRVGERLGALGTLVRLGLTHVTLLVQLHVRLRVEDLGEGEKHRKASG